MKCKSLAQAVLVAGLLLLIGVISASAVNLHGGLSPEPFSSPLAADLDRPSLARIAWEHGNDLVAVEVSGMMVYDRLTDEDGLHLLEGQGVGSAMWDPGVAQASYYSVDIPPDQDPRNWAPYGQPTLDDGQRVLLSAPPHAVGRLTRAGANLRTVRPTPKPLVPAVGGGTIPRAVIRSPDIQAMMDKVDGDTLYRYVGDFSGEWPVMVEGEWVTITTRFTDSGEPIQKSVQYAGEHMEALGLDVEYHTWDPDRPPNVIGELPGETNPDNIVILCAHVDSTTHQNPMALAPGADDNASGAAAVLVAADILSQYEWDCTLRFALWTGEEQGLLGSKAYAQRASGIGEDIAGVLNLDMIAWDGIAGPDIDLHATQSLPPTLDLAQLFSNVVGTYELNLVPQIVTDGFGRSDHVSFWDSDYPAILGCEDYYPSEHDFNPFYHSTDDQLEHLDMDYFVEFARAALGTFAHMECGISDDPSHGYYSLPVVMRDG